MLYLHCYLTLLKGTNMSFTKKGSEDMDMKITRNYAAYQNAVSNAKHTEKNMKRKHDLMSRR